MPSSARLRAYGAAVVVVIVACALYYVGPHNAQQLRMRYGAEAFWFTGAQALWTAGVIYALLLAPAFLRGRGPCDDKSLRFLRVVGSTLRSPSEVRATPLTGEDRVAVLASLLKIFFAPLMAMQLLAFCDSALHEAAALFAAAGATGAWRVLFDRHGFWLVMHTLLFIDVLVYTTGYLVESPRLGNRIRSVDSTLRGWLAALLCYPPFNVLTGAVLGSNVSDFPRFDDPTTHVLANVVLLALMAVFAWSSVAMGWKASNLTHRGIVCRGPYAWVRHPAYAAKNLAWWIGATPLAASAFAQSWLAGLTVVASVAAWTLLYLLRALTEEDHLRSVDGEYAAYAARVRHRFVPGLV